MTRVAPRRHWSLRRRLALAVVGLLAAVAIVIGAVSVLALQGFLMSRLDDQLTAATGRSQGGFGPPGSGEAPGSSAERFILTLNRQAPGTVIAFVSNGVTLAVEKDQKTGRQQQLPASDARVLEAASTRSDPMTVDLGGDLGNYRVATATFSNGDRVVTGLPLSDVQEILLQLVVVIAIVTVVGIALAAVLATIIVRLALRPLQRVIATATRVSELSLDRGEVALAVRVPPSDADPRTEVGQVGAAINRMLGHVASALTARQASERKVRQFVADASHELRTPLASIRGYSELTRRGDHDLPEDVVHAMGRVESEATRMTSLVEDLLLLARLDEGRDLDRAPVDLSRLLIDAVSDAHAAGPDHEWSLDLPEEPVEVIGDAARLHQVVANLLANARVHTPASTRVTAALAKDAAGHAVVTISDDGPGIPDDLRPVLFERFARGDGSRSRAAGSTGLGLAIVRAVVTGHGGTVSVDSVPGKTSFRVELPLG
ncbi:sensor histidine kinase [Parafrigoribacterium humi]|jgi:two-component system OmpR family sensor kinase|uniref:sensor histidine kinase n=1 Tax=Parafrigoribacterium humi TaxID=3144664 RepID=UPI0032EB9C74